MAQERMVGVEEARSSLGRLVDDVARGDEVVALTKRGRARAVLISRDEYARLVQIGNRDARAELRQRLAEIRRTIKAAGLDPSVVDDAVAAERHLA